MDQSTLFVKRPELCEILFSAWTVLTFVVVLDQVQELEVWRNMKLVTSLSWNFLHLRIQRSVFSLMRVCNPGLPVDRHQFWSSQTAVFAN